MKKITATLLTAVLLVSLTGCKPNEESPDTPTDSGGSSAITDSSDNSGSSGSSSAPESAPEPPKPEGEPTFLTSPDGTPIYTSEISEIYTGSEEFGNKKPLILAEAEQIAQTGDGDFTVKCDGFFYGYIPERALNRMDNPEMFKDSGEGKSFDFLGVSDKEPYDKRPINLIRFNTGDKFGKLTVKNAYTLYRDNWIGDDVPNVFGTHISDGYIEFDGEIELEGYVCVTPMETLYGEGGDMTFFPNGESSTKLPYSSREWNQENNEYYSFTCVNYSGYFGDWQLALGNMYKVDCDTSGLQPGDSFVKVKVVLDNIRYVPGDFSGLRVDLKNIEVL